MAYQEGGGYPDLATIRLWIRVAATNLDDPQLEHIAGAEQTLQAQLAIPAGELPEDLYQAFLRRIARHAAARGLALGIIGLDSEFGTSRLPRWDAEVERLEAPYYVPVIA